MEPKFHIESNQGVYVSKDNGDNWKANDYLIIYMFGLLTVYENKL